MFFAAVFSVILTPHSNTESVVGEGGAQLMQTGSGVFHAEAIKEPTEVFQIWFENKTRLIYGFFVSGKRPVKRLLIKCQKI